MTTPSQEETKIQASVTVRRLISPLILRTEIGDGEIRGIPFELSLSVSGSFIVNFEDVYYLLDNESFISTCLENFINLGD